MKKKRRQAIGNYTRHLANEMGLRDWHLDIVFKTELPDSVLSNGDDDEFAGIASCTPVPGQKRATIAFLPMFDQLPLVEIREVVVHELLHCHFGPLYECGRAGLHGEIAQQSYNLFMFGFAQAWETAVDGIARPWAQSMPLIDWTLNEAPAETD